MISWRISKYNPLLRNINGYYLIDEWTSFSDIGREFSGKKFTYQNYLSIENAYISVIELIIQTININSLKIENLEMTKGSKVETNCVPIYKTMHEGATIKRDGVNSLCRLILREVLWCKLINNGKIWIHFGYDYYMYIGTILSAEDISEIVTSNGLFFERFKSPYL